MLNNLSLRARLASLVAGTALPLIIFAIGVVYVDHLQDREREFDRVLENTRAVRHAYDSEVQSITAGLQVLALSQSLAREDTEGFRANVEAFLMRFPAGANISLADSSGRQLLNSARRPEDPLPLAKRETLPVVFKTGAPAYSNLFHGPVTGEPIVVIDVPVYRDGKVVYSLSFNPPLSIFQRLIEEKKFGPEWTVSIFDRAGNQVARVPNPEKTVGKAKASPSLLAQMFEKQEDKILTTSLEGVDLLTAYSRSPVTQWTVAAGISIDRVTEPLWRRLALTALIGSALLLVGLGFAIRMAQEVARGESLQRLMVDELNHRVKNTLATVQSIAGQSFRAASDHEAKQKFESRLVALGRAHNILSDERWQSADMNEIVRAVFEPMGLGEGQRVQRSGPSVRLSPRTALIVSMVLHELATNAVKYGAISEHGGRIYLDWTVKGEGKDQRVYLTWRELGGPAVSEPLSKGFGSRLIEQSVVAQLGGRARIDYARSGVVCMLEFPAA